MSDKNQQQTTILTGKYSALTEAPEPEIKRIDGDPTAFTLLCRFIRRQHERELASGEPFADDRATAYQRAYAYAQGVAEARGITLPDLYDAPDGADGE